MIMSEGAGSSRLRPRVRDYTPSPLRATPPDHVDGGDPDPSLVMAKGSCHSTKWTLIGAQRGLLLGRVAWEHELDPTCKVQPKRRPHTQSATPTGGLRAPSLMGHAVNEMERTGPYGLQTIVFVCEGRRAGETPDLERIR